MAENSKIEWTHHTFNPWRGCTKISDGCTNCYADTMSVRNPKTLGVWGKYGTRVVASESMWREPLKWDKKAFLSGEQKRVFSASLADVFEGPETMPTYSWKAVSEARERLGTVIDNTSHLNWLLLTKRPDNVLKYGPLGYRWSHDGLPENVWIGTSVEDQKTADERIPHLLKIPTAVRFLSVEPLLGPVDLFSIVALDGDGPGDNSLYWIGIDAGIDWVIIGTESGPHRRPAKLEWIESVVEQCKAAGVPVFVKQIELNGRVEKDIEKFPANLQYREFPK